MVEALIPHPPEYDICIVGAGPAGLTIASQLAYTGLRLCVLESGETERSPFGDSLKQVEFDCLPIKANSRERVVGGTSATWDGRSALLDQCDFEPHGWPGWPICRDEILRFVADAVQYRFPALRDFDVPRDGSWGPCPDLALKMFVAIKPPYRFNSIQAIFERPGIDMWTGATVTRLKSRAAGDGYRTVTAAVCRNRSGQEVEVTARKFVLASGGIENARLLLNSCTETESGSLGNEHDQVGRYFMNHPKGYAGILHLTHPMPGTSPFLERPFQSRTTYAALTLAPGIQRAQGLLNSYVRFEPHDTIGHEILARVDRLRVRVHDSNKLRSLARISGRWWASMIPPVRTLRLRWYLEMEPRSTNRVALSDKTDTFGSRLPHVHYELGDRDRATVAALHAILQQNLARLQFGRLESTVEDVLAAATMDASHHLGSTRMGADPKTSVVNADSRVHRATNLFVAGGSVFASGGCANPTLTIVALAIRLAAHLRSLSRPAADVTLETPPSPVATFIVIGAGRRVTSDVVPGLESHGGLFQIGGIYARSAASVFGVRRRYDVQPLDSLRGDPLNGAQFVYVAVPRDAVVPVLKVLRRWPNREIILDTPVPTSERALALLRGFPRVHIAEDCAYLPWLDGVRLFWARNGLTGAVQIDCDRSAYRYHGVALAKALCGTREAPATVLGAERRGAVFSIRLDNGTATIIEPRDYAVGTLRVMRGGITIASHAAEGAVPIEILKEDGLCVGFDIGGARVSLSRPESVLVGKLAPGDTVVSLMGRLKRVGLARMFAMIQQQKEPWPLAQGLDDSRVDQVGPGE